MSSSTPGNAFTNPSSGKIDQQRKILEELERRKKQLNQPSSANLVSTNNSMNNSNHVALATPPATNANSVLPQPGPHLTPANPESQQMLNNNQRAALEVANKSSFGYFIPQDSNFGNHILPVIPRT